MPSIDDWQPFGYSVEQTSMHFDIFDDHVIVECQLILERKEGSTDPSIFLNGQTKNEEGYGLELTELLVDEVSLDNNEYQVSPDGLTIHSLPDKCEVKISQKLTISPHAVDGLYHSGSTLVTQCEDEAFRRISYYPDRPDVLSKWKVSIEAEDKKFPVLLSNGNQQSSQFPTESRRCVIFEDPHPKPSYLFALVAGNLASLSSEYKTRDDRKVDLRIYSDPKSIRQCKWAMASLKSAMNWDEVAYDRVYDLDKFSIVAVERFVFGAMENKSLNVFNNSVLLANPDVATDSTYDRIQSIVGHEYFHNYSGNRVTVRDWFQLSLKEGFTRLRDQAFSRDLNGRELYRILDTNVLRNEQFPEAQSGLAHSVRPMEMAVPANYYTRTIYEGGAELAYMLSNMLGPSTWQLATNHYFEKFDGQAVTVDDFVEAIEESSQRDLTQFKLWYSTPGTPKLEILEARQDGTIELTITQSIDSGVELESEPTLMIPVGIGVVDEHGNDLLVPEDEQDEDDATAVHIETSVDLTEPNKACTQVCFITEKRSTIYIKNVPERAHVSVLRDFSAPVEIEYLNASTRVEDEIRLREVATWDTNGFARFDAVEKIYIGSMLGDELYLAQLKEIFSNRIEKLLEGVSLEQERIAVQELLPPYEGRVLDRNRGNLVETIFAGKQKILNFLGNENRDEWQKLIDKYSNDKPYEPNPEQIAAREIVALAYQFLSKADPVDGAPDYAEVFATKIRQVDNLTERLSFFTLLLEQDGHDDLRSEVTDELYEQFNHEALVLERWMSALVKAPALNARDQISRFESMGLLENATPNRWRAAFQTYTDNWENFHLADGSGYDYYTERLLQDAKTHSAMVRRGIQPFAYLNRYDEGRQAHMRKCLERLQTELPSDAEATLDMVARSLNPSP